MLILLVLFLAVTVCAVFGVPIYAILLGFIAILILACAFVIIKHEHEIKVAESIATAILIDEKTVYERKAEHTGYSVSFNERRDHYTYVDVPVRRECTFSVYYKDGRRGTLKCTKNSSLYSLLIAKRKK